MATMKRSLTAILFADAVGYSRHMRESEQLAVRSIVFHISAIKHLIDNAGGTYHGGSGDSVLATFNSVRDAVRCARTIQAREPAPDDLLDIQFRIGIHIGDMVEVEGELHGDSVNIAARLEPIAPPGGICVSRSVYDALRGEAEFTFISLGRPNLKYVGEDLEVFAIEDADTTTRSGDAGTAKLSKAVSLRSSRYARAQWLQPGPQQPSILVRPFAALGDDTQTKFFAIGFTTDLISRLARYRHLDVIGRASSFDVDASALDASAAARVDVRYVASGQFQIIGTKLQATAVLVDAQTEVVLWSESFRRDLDDIFAVQAEIVEIVAAAMAVEIDRVELEAARARDPDNLDAYSLVIHGRLENMEDGATGRTATDRAMRFFTNAVELAPSYSSALAGIARAHSVRWRFGWSDDRNKSMENAVQYALRAVDADQRDAIAHAGLAFVRLYRREHDRSLAAYEQALRLNPSDVEIIASYADALKHYGEPERAVPLFEKALRLNPLRPDLYLSDMAHAYFLQGDYETAIRTIHQMRQPLTAQRVLTASLMLAGREHEGRREAEILRRHLPGFSAAEWCKIVPDRLPEHSAMLQEGLERAGF